MREVDCVGGYNTINDISRSPGRYLPLPLPVAEPWCAHANWAREEGTANRNITSAIWAKLNQRQAGRWNCQAVVLRLQCGIG